MKNKLKFFLSCVQPILELKEAEFIPNKVKAIAQSICLNHLNKKNMGQLRDSFEGQHYYDKMFRLVTTLYMIEKKIGKSPIDLSMLKVNRSMNMNQFHIKNKYYTLVSFIHGSLPKIDLNSNTDILIFCIISDYSKAWFVGRLQRNSLKNSENFQFQTNSKKTCYLINFECLVDDY